MTIDQALQLSLASLAVVTWLLVWVMEPHRRPTRTLILVVISIGFILASWAAVYDKPWTGVFAAWNRGVMAFGGLVVLYRRLRDQQRHELR